MTDDEGKNSSSPKAPWGEDNPPDNDLGPNQSDETQAEVTNQDIATLAAELSVMEKRYAEQRVFYGKSHKEAIRNAGSSAQEKYLSKLGWEMEQRPHVAAYILALKKIRSLDAAISIREVVDKARQGLEMAFLNKKPKDGEGYLRLLAEIGGFLKTSKAPGLPNSGPTSITEEASSLDDDMKKLKSLFTPGKE